MIILYEMSKRQLQFHHNLRIYDDAQNNVRRYYLLQHKVRVPYLRDRLYIMKRPKFDGLKLTRCRPKITA